MDDDISRDGGGGRGFIFSLLFVLLPCLFPPPVFFILFFFSFTCNIAMPKLPKQLRTSRGARVDPSPLKDLPEVSVASTFKPTVMNDDTEMEVDPPPITTALKRNKRESKKSMKFFLEGFPQYSERLNNLMASHGFFFVVHVSCLLAIATQKPSISRAEGQRPKAYQQKILRKNMARNGDYPSGWPKVVPTLKFTKKGGTGYRKNKTSADTTKTDSKKVSKDIAELSNILQARFSVFDETM